MSANETMHARKERRAVSLIYGVAFSYQISLGAMQVLVPLYGLHLGYDIASLGFILSAQAVVPILTRFFAGAIADTFGDRWVLWFSFTTMVLAAAVFASSGWIWSLVAAQTIHGLSRSTYWTVTQSYASRINQEQAATRLGRLSSSGHAGSIIGTAVAGILAESIGYTSAFAFVGGTAVAGFFGSLGLPVLGSPRSRRGFRAALAPIPTVATTRAMGMAGFSAFIASCSVMLGIILTIPLMKESNLTESEIGIARTLAAVGSLTAGLFFGKLIVSLGLRNLHATIFLLQGMTFLSMPALATQLPSSLALMYIYGLFSGVMGSLYPTAAATFSRVEHRGTAMGYAGQFWGTAQLVTPVGGGLLAAKVGLTDSLYIAGIAFIGLAIISPLFHAWVTRGWKPENGVQTEEPKMREK